MHLAEPAGRQRSMLLDGIHVFPAARILHKEPTIFRLWFVNGAIIVQSGNRQMWQDLLIDGFLDLRRWCPGSLGNDSRAARARAVKAENARLPTLSQYFNTACPYALRAKSTPGLGRGMLGLARSQ